MHAWRITRAAYQALDGEGARLNGGRWNSDGVAVVYLSSTLSLAALEYLVHDDIEDAPLDLLAMRLLIPDDCLVEGIDVASLPEDWSITPNAAECVRRGDEWIRTASSLLLKIPSAVVPEEMNLLLNPAHRDAARVTVSLVRAFTFDSRLLG